MSRARGRSRQVALGQRTQENAVVWRTMGSGWWAVARSESLTRRRGLALASMALVAVACARSLPSDAPRVASSAPDGASPEYFMVWGDSKQLGPRSYWFGRVDGQLKLRGELSGVVLLVEDGIYRFQHTEGQRYVWNSCPEYGEGPSDEPSSDNRREVTVVGASLQRLDAAGVIEVAALPDVSGAEQFANDVTLSGSFGPYLLVDFSEDALYCGAAHGATSSSLHAFDLRTRATEPYPSPRDGDELRRHAFKTQRPALQACLAQRSTTLREPLGEEVLEELRVSAVVPAWSNGSFGLDTTLSVQRSHVEGIIECTVRLESVPGSLSAVTLPQGLTEAVSQLRSVEVHGFSSLHRGQHARVPVIDGVVARETKQLHEP
jgi:hypothetical protein